jgi:hypothetical protein
MKVQKTLTIVALALMASGVAATSFATSLSGVVTSNVLTPQQVKTNCLQARKACNHRPNADSNSCNLRYRKCVGQTQTPAASSTKVSSGGSAGGTKTATGSSAGAKKSTASSGGTKSSTSSSGTTTPAPSATDILTGNVPAGDTAKLKIKGKICDPTTNECTKAKLNYDTGVKKH